MSYDPTEWVNGDIITANALNNLELGVARSLNAIIVDIVSNNGLLLFADGEGEAYSYDDMLSLFENYDVILARYKSRLGAYLLAEVQINNDSILCAYTDIYVSQGNAYITDIFIDLEENGYEISGNTYYVAVTAYNPEPPIS